MATERLTIEGMGQLGEGVTSNRGKPVFVPFALPGERVEALLEGNRAALVAIEQASADRVAPFCRYFGVCGGCATQHWSETAYRHWKRTLVQTSLSFAGLSPEIAPLIDAHGAGRRRVKFHVRSAGTTRAGFMRAKTHDLVDIEACPILEPQLGPAPDIARRLGEALARLRKPLGVQFTATRTGLDVDVTGAGAIDFETRLALTEIASRTDCARLSIHGDIVVERRRPLLRFGGVEVAIPPGGFTQATEAGEATLAGLVIDALQTSRKVADLFSGVGPFALRLAGHAAVHALDSDAAAIAALQRAANAVGGLKPVTSETRDLFRRPLLAAELKPFDAVVLDPPRAGAEAQMREIAGSAVRTVISVSCNAGSFARDAALLVAGGYRLERVTPVDQFKWSPHVELVGVFRR